MFWLAHDGVICVLMTSIWIFITDFLGSRLFILFFNHKMWSLPKAHKSTKHATKMIDDNWPLSHQTFPSKISTTSCIQDLSDIHFNTNRILNDLLIKILSLWMVWQQIKKKCFWGTSEWLYHSFYQW